MKKIRQNAILDLVRNQEIASQEELLEKLLARRIDVSQSTLSRDIQELRLAKTGGVYAVMGAESAPLPMIPFGAFFVSSSLKWPLPRTLWY